MCLSKSLTFLLLLFLTNISFAQEKTFKISPFDMTFTEGHLAPCERMQDAQIKKNAASEYYIDGYYFYIEVGAKFKLNGKDIENVQVYERAMFRYAVKMNETEGDLFYEKMSVQSKANFFSEWTKITAKEGTYTITEDHPFFPSAEIVNALPIQATIAPEEAAKSIKTVATKDEYGKEFFGHWDFNNELWVAKRARQIMIKYTQNNVPRTRIITFFSERGGC